MCRGGHELVEDTEAFARKLIESRRERELEEGVRSSTQHPEASTRKGTESKEEMQLLQDVRAFMCKKQFMCKKHRSCEDARL